MEAFVTCLCGCPPVQSVSVEIQVAGDGKNYPKEGQTVTIHYTGFVRGLLALLIAVRARITLCAYLIGGTRLFMLTAGGWYQV